MAARVIFLLFCYFLCLNASNDVTTQTSTKIPTHSAPGNLEGNITTRATIPPAASDTEATSVPSVNTTTTNNEITQSVYTPTSAASNNVTTAVKPDNTPTTPSNNTVMESVHTTISGVVTEVNKQQQTTQSMETSKTTNTTEQGLNKSVATTDTGKRPVEDGGSGLQSKEETDSKSFDGRYLWLLVLVIAVVAAGMYLKFKCCKIHHHPVENIGHGTENASFQRTESKDGVMLLGVKSGGEENVSAK